MDLPFLLISFFSSSKCVEFRANFFIVPQIFYHRNNTLLCITYVWHICFIKLYINLYVLDLKKLASSFSTYLCHMPTCPICGAGSHMVQRLGKSLYLLLLMRGMKCVSIPRVLLAMCALIFNLVSTEKKVKNYSVKSVPNFPLSPAICWVKCNDFAIIMTF